MPTQLANPVTHQDHAVATVSERVDPTDMPCKSALFKGDSCDGIATAKAPSAPTAATCETPVSTAAMAAEAEEFAGSKAQDDMTYALNWLRERPDIHARVLAVMKQYDTKYYQRSSSSNVPFWREVMLDLVGKAGHTTDPSSNNSDVEPKDGQNEDDSLFVIDLARIVVQYAKFKRNFPRLHPHYAMKCNDSIPMIAMISALGGGFDCASKGEFTTVIDGGYQTAEGIIYAHPCKMANNIMAANRRGVYLTTFDNEEELEKLHRYMPKARAVLRIATDDRAALCEFSTKFGCPVSETTNLLTRAKALGVNVVGVSFHVGSGNSSHAAYERAIRDARAIFNVGAEMGFEMNLVDIGGGFPGSDPLPDPVTGERVLFEDIAGFIRPLLDELFPEGSGVHLIAEPGRYFAESPYAIGMQVHSKRKLKKRDGTEEYQYYTSDGKYQAFNCMIYDHAHPNIQILRPDTEAKIRNTTIFGPTCDSIDWIMKQQPFPNLDIGDWLFVPDFGAYTVAAGSKFNGFLTRRIEYISSLDIFE